MKFTVPDICDEFYEKIQIGDSFYNSYGGIEKFYGEIRTVQCEHSNSVVKDIVKNNGKGKVLFISHTGKDLCSMVGDQIAQIAYENQWSGIVVDGYIRDVEVIKDIQIGLYAKNTFPKKTDKTVGTGQINVPFKIKEINIVPGYWIYVDSNGWAISNSKLEF